jgi:hypothetical protein
MRIHDYNTVPNKSSLTTYTLYNMISYMSCHKPEKIVYMIFDRRNNKYTFERFNRLSNENSIIKNEKGC